MRSTIKLWSIAFLALLALALTALAPAQLYNFPQRKGDLGGTGKNANPVTDNPLAAALKWYAPGLGAINSQTMTNASVDASFAGFWPTPILGNSAEDAYVYDGTDTVIGNNFNAPYNYTVAVPSDTSGDPRVPLNGYAAGSFAWTYSGTANTPANYAIYVNIPLQPTIDLNGNYHYAPQYYVFEIDYGNNQTFIDVVDTHLGGNYVRLGNGGGATNMLFNYNGTNPIVVKLYNTIPRDASGNLSGVATTIGGLPLDAYYLYANAVTFTQDYGLVNSSPIVAMDNQNTINVFSAVNLDASITVNGAASTHQVGLLQAFTYNYFNVAAPSNTPVWTFSPLDQGNVGLTLDQPAGTQITASSGWNDGTTATFPSYQGFVGADFYYMPVVTPGGGATFATADKVTYSPALSDGTYDVLMWLPGVPTGTGAPTFSPDVQVEVDEGPAGNAGSTQTIINVNLTQTNGYVSLGSLLPAGSGHGPRFANTAANPLVIKISNYDPNNADAGLLAYADALRFVGSAGLSITSTPVQATVPIAYRYFDTTQGQYVTTTAQKSVVIFGTEDGRIYCVDAHGRGDGTTDIYWAYPSLASPDPNNTNNGPDGTNGVTSAQMPTGFSLSSPMVQTINGEPYLYIAANNGRIYCIDVTGRGDGNLTTRTPGTTRRIWTYPDDYRPDSPTTPAVPSALGATNASVVFNQNASGPTIFVASAEGRMFALDAGGNSTTTTTTLKWAYPALTSATTGPMNSTPAIDTPSTSGTACVYVGTERKGGTDIGQFFSLNAETGAVNWVFQGSAEAADDFEGGPTTAFNGVVGDAANPDYVFVSNQNNYIYALNATNGSVIWQTNELASGVTAPLTYTNLTVFTDAIGGTGTVPIVMVPTSSGYFMGLFANVNSTNVNGAGDRLAYGYQPAGSTVYSGMATGQGWMYGADSSGFIYGFQGGSPGGLGGLPSGPGNPVGVPNDPDSAPYRDAKVAFYTETAYRALRSDVNPNFATYTAPGEFLTGRGTPPAFDFGETLYIFVYNFPSGLANGSTTPTTVTYQLSVEGLTLRQTAIQARQFTVGAPDTNHDGFAVLPFPLQVGGINSMAPGNGYVTISFNGTGGSGIRKTFFESSTNTKQSFAIANPLGVGVRDSNVSNNPVLDANGYGMYEFSLGADEQPASGGTYGAFRDAGNWQNQFNGSISYSGVTPFRPSLLFSTGGIASHGNEATSETVYLFDRSLMALLTGPDTPNNAAITNLRVDRTDESWQGGYGNVIKPLSGSSGLYTSGAAATLLGKFEDLPTQFPNISLDYPNILRQNLLTTLNPNANSSNPSSYQVPLPMPSNLFVAGTNGPVGNPAASRTPNGAPLQLDTIVPRYQPANLDTLNNGSPVGDVLNSVGAAVSAGYLSQLTVYTDASGSGHLNLTGNNRDSYRTFNYGVNVAVDEHISVLTPSVDLGSLAGGTGMLLLNNGNASYQNVRDPWTDLTGGAANQIYGAFQAVNDGNVNLWNVRAAHRYNNANGYFPWPFYDSANDDLAAIDGSFFLHSSLDPNFSASSPAFGGPFANGEVFAQKARTTDVSGHGIVSNPVNRPNGNLGQIGNTAVNPALPAGTNPTITVTPAIGIPAGSYQQIIRVIEDYNYLSPTSSNNYDLSILLGNGTAPGETYADPTLTLSYNVRENRLTNSFSAKTAPALDNFATSTFMDSNIEPAGMRDREFGNLFVAWASNRPTLGTGTMANATSYNYRIYMGTMAGSSNMTTAPLSELPFNQQNGTNSWFYGAGPYPVGPSSSSLGAVNSLFGVTLPDHVVGTAANEEDTVRFGQPAFPSRGMVNPLNSGLSNNDFGHTLMAFIGSCDIKTPTGLTNQSRMFVATVTPQANGPSQVGSPVSSNNDADTPKGKPAIVQYGNDQATIIYSGASGGRSRLFAQLYNAGAFSASVPIDTGVGFDSVSDPSAIGRAYLGADTSGLETTTGFMMELSFAGRLRGRANSEVFLARMPTDQNGVPQNTKNSNQEYLSYFATRFSEQLQAQVAKGVYRSIGVAWNPNNINNPAANPTNFDLGIGQGTAQPTSILLPNVPRAYDPQSGIATVQTTMGTVYVNTLEGTVRFANSVPGTDYNVYATYQPKFLRISQTASASSSNPGLIWDDHRVGSTNYNGASGLMFDRFWYTNLNGNPAHDTLNDPLLLNSRYWVFYDRAASGAGIPASPAFETLRLGAQLSVPVPTTTSGDVNFGAFNVNGNRGPFQVDPTNGRVYFTALDEDNVVTITVGNLAPQKYLVTLVQERQEQNVRIEQAINEQHVAPFLDPFDNPQINERRPDMVWLLWSSTRAGTSDIYFETIAPLLWPVLK